MTHLDARGQQQYKLAEDKYLSQVHAKFCQDDMRQTAALRRERRVKYNESVKVTFTSNYKKNKMTTQCTNRSAEGDDTKSWCLSRDRNQDELDQVRTEVAGMCINCKGKQWR